MTVVYVLGIDSLFGYSSNCPVIQCAPAKMWQTATNSICFVSGISKTRSINNFPLNDIEAEMLLSEFQSFIRLGTRVGSVGGNAPE